MFKKIILISLILISNLLVVYSDNNGIWHYAKDVRGGIFANDENEKDFSFIGLVTFNNNAYFMSNVGIGTSSPSTKLDIIGNVSIIGNINISSIYDRENNAYYVNPYGNSVMYRLYLKEIIDLDGSGDFYLNMSGTSKLNRLYISSKKNCNKIMSDSNGELICGNDNVDDADSVIGNEYPIAGTGIIIDNSRRVNVDTNIIATKTYVDTKVSTATSTLNEPPTCNGKGNYLQYDNGWICYTPKYSSCLGWYNAGFTTDGIYNIDPDEDGPKTSYNVYCDMTTDGGGWTMVALSDRAENWDFDSTLWDSGSEYGTLPPSTVANQNYRSKAYGDILSDEILVKSFNTDIDSGSPNGMKFVFADENTALDWFTSNPAVNAQDVFQVIGSSSFISNAYDHIKFVGKDTSRTCHHYANGIKGRLCVTREIDYNSAYYIMWGADYTGVGTGDYFFPRYDDDNRYYLMNSEGNAVNNCGGSNYYTCPERQFSIWVR